MLKLDDSLLRQLYGDTLPTIPSELQPIRKRLAHTLKNSLASGHITPFLFEQLLAMPDTGMRATYEWVVDEIRNLEFNLQSSTKKSLPFQDRLLKGLFHKHFFVPRFNSTKGLCNYINSSLWIKNTLAHSRALCASSEATLDDWVDKIAQHTIEDWEKRKKTGHWLIYAKYAEQNYYLCICPHPIDRSQDTEIRLICLKAASFFPELKNILR